MRILNEQSYGDLRREMRLALLATDYVFNKYGHELVITWVRGGSHKEGSLHFKGRAFDALLPTGPSGGLFLELRGFLGADFDVVVEGDQLHVEHDPK